MEKLRLDAAELKKRLMADAEDRVLFQQTRISTIEDQLQQFMVTAESPAAA